MQGNEATSGRFRRELLPAPAPFYSNEVGKLHPIATDWTTVCCVFHRDKKPSLRINLNTGGFYCLACGAKGGDVIDFVMKRYGLDFVAAAKYVGAWDDQPLSEAERSEFDRKRRAQHEARVAAERLEHEIRYQRHAVRTELNLLEELSE